MTRTLDLGCGMHPQNPFGADEVFGVDVVELPVENTKVADLIVEPLPYDDDYFDFVTGFDFIEHIPRVIYYGTERRQPFIDIMSEVWRVLKPNGQVLFATPAFPYPETFQDPQHVNFITDKTVSYFCVPTVNLPMPSGIALAKQYGFKGEFELINQVWRPDVSYHLLWHLRALKG